MATAYQAIAASLAQFSRRAFSVSSRACSLALADMREPRQPSHPISSAALVSSLDQRLIGKALAGGSTNKAFQSRESVMPHVAFIEAEGKFVNISARMFRAGVVIDADQPALENRENAFISVGGHVVSNILASAMIDSIMDETRVVNARICASFVGMQCRSDFDMLMNSGLNCSLVWNGTRSTASPSRSGAARRCNSDRHCRKTGRRR
jgi:hypothetical protein